MNAQETFRFHTIHPQGISVESSTAQGIKLHYALREISTTEGLPNLRCESRYIALPHGATINVKVKENGRSTLNDIDLSPITEMIPGADFSSTDIVTTQTTRIRGLDVALLSITPFQYDPAQKTLEVIYDIDIDIRFEGGNGQFGEERYLNPDWEHILSNLVINKEMLPSVDYYRYIHSLRGRDEVGGEYLIITPDDPSIRAWADTLKAFRTKQGISTKVVSLSECGGTSPDNIRNYILNAYDNWAIPPAAILLFGGYHNGNGIRPFYHVTIPDETYPARTYPTDYPYCDMNGDSLPDMAISRVSARTLNEYETYVRKTIQYETYPPTDATYYDRPIVTTGHDDNKWFLISAQSINGFYRNKLGKHPTNLYMLHNTSASPPDSIWSTGYNASVLTDYFGPAGQGYIPGHVGDLHEWITKSDTVPLHSALNEGSFLTMYRGHANYNAWWFPAFRVISLSNLVNEPPTFIFSICCSTTLFTESGRCLIDAFCIKENGGALGGIGAASLTHSYFNDILAWGIYDCIWPDFLPDIGGDTPPDFVRPAYALSGAKNYFAYHFFLPNWWPAIEQSTMNLFGYTGETYLNLYTEAPQPLQITHGLYHTANASEFTVAAEEGTVICLSRNGAIIDVAKSQGQPCTFMMPDMEEGTHFTITATKQNRFRYEYEVPIIANNGAYVVVENDGVLIENEFNVLHNGENANIGLKLHNYGNNTASNITMSLSCESEFIEITQGTCTYQSIAPHQTATIHNAFRFNIADNTPDMAEAIFILHIDDGNGVKECRFTQHIAAPSLVVGPSISFKNSSQQSILQLNKEGITDIHVQIANVGHFDSDPVNIQLEVLAPFITVDSPSIMLNAIEKGGTRNAVFRVNAQNSTIDEGWLMTKILLNDGTCQTHLDTLLPFGGFNESFDPDLFSAHNWQLSGNALWTVTDDEAHSDEYSAQSGVISHSQSSSMAITRATQATEISFYRKMSSEFNYDKLFFYIDNEEMGQWSGSRPWSEERYPLSQGTHTFKWSYVKDNSVSLGQDCAWIDDINIDPTYATIAYSGDSVKTCRGENVNINCSYAYHYQELTWTTSGDGHFDDNHALHPVYTTGLQDLINGGALLHMNVDGTDYPLQLILTDEISMGSSITGSDIIDPESTPFSHYSVEEQTGIGYHWQLEPEEAGRVFAYGNEADVVWNFNSNIMEAILTVSADASCSQSLSKTIQIDLLSVKEQNLLSLTLFPNPTDGKVNLTIEEPLQGKATVEIYNLLGERLSTKKVSNLAKGSTVSIDLSRLTPGLYIIKLNAEKGSVSKKVSLK